jgi:hypothetical protein
MAPLNLSLIASVVRVGVSCAACDGEYDERNLTREEIWWQCSSIEQMGKEDPVLVGDAGADFHVVRM